jgi:hypothetical protein
MKIRNKICKVGYRLSLPTSERHMACETFEWFNVSVYPERLVIRAWNEVEVIKVLTSKDVSFKMFISSERLAAVCAENHDGVSGLEKPQQTVRVLDNI